MHSCGKIVLIFATVLLSIGNIAAEPMNDDGATLEEGETERTTGEATNISVLADEPLPFSIETASAAFKSLGRPLKVETGDFRDVPDEYSKITQRTIKVYYKGIRIDYLRLQYPNHVHEFLVYLHITDPARALKLGIKVGTKERELVKLLGQPDKRKDNKFVYSHYNEGGSAEDISFMIKNGIVQSIEISVTPD